jgi:probable F420-dependent oxidoreductase
MEVHAGGYPADALAAAAGAQAAESAGFDGYSVPETQIDAIVGCAAAAVQTTRIKLSTGITVAFARNPMTVAQQANDVQILSAGRFALGLGSQIKPHITRRFSMPWSHPAPRMREFILAVRAIWSTWATGAPLDFQGEFYRHTLMTPFFNPGPNPHGPPNIVLAGVGPKMTEVAGEVADGFISHGFVTERYLREVTVPALERGRRLSGQTLEGFEIGLPAFVVAGDSADERAAGVQFVRGQIAFYGSTPAYRPVLDLHGWGDLQEQLHAMTKAGAWDQLATVIDDEVLHTFGIIGTPEEVVAELRRRYAGVATQITLPLGPDHDRDRWAPLFAQLREPVSV